MLLARWLRLSLVASVRAFSVAGATSSSSADDLPVSPSATKADRGPRWRREGHGGSEAAELDIPEAERSGGDAEVDGGREKHPKVPAHTRRLRAPQEALRLRSNIDQRRFSDTSTACRRRSDRNFRTLVSCCANLIRSKSGARVIRLLPSLLTFHARRILFRLSPALVKQEGESEPNESLEPAARIRWEGGRRRRRVAEQGEAISSPAPLAMDSGVGVGGGSGVSSGGKASRASKKESEVETPSGSTKSGRSLYACSDSSILLFSFSSVFFSPSPSMTKVPQSRHVDVVPLRVM